MEDSDKPRSLEEIDSRLRALRAEVSNDGGRAPRTGLGAGMGLGFRVAVELVAGIAVGGFIGYFLDRWIGTKPWAMVVFLFLGAAAGVMNAYRAAKGLDDTVGLDQARRRRSKTATENE